MSSWIVIVGNGVTALSTIRAIQSVKNEGTELILLSTSKINNVAWHSRIPNTKLVIKDLVESLLAIAKKKNGKGTLLLTTDESAVTVNLNRTKLSGYYKYWFPNSETFDILMEKSKFQSFAEEHNLPVPKTIRVKNVQELSTAGSELTFPCIVKPYLLHSRIINSQRQLEEYANGLSSSNFYSCVVQEYVQGDDDQLYFCLLLYSEDGQCIQKLSAKKLRQWPRLYGTTSLAVSLENSELMKKVEEFTSCFSPKGYLSIEFKYDKIREEFFIMEPTVGRFNQQIALSVKAGVNIPLKLVKLLRGEKVDSDAQKNGIYWIYESNDFFSWRKSKTGYGYFRNYFKHHYKVLFSFFDPMPMIMEIVFMARKKVRKLIHA